MVKNLPAMQEVWSPVSEDSLEEKMATHSSILASTAGYCSYGLKESDTLDHAYMHVLLTSLGLHQCLFHLFLLV